MTLEYWSSNYQITSTRQRQVDRASRNNTLMLSSILSTFLQFLAATMEI